MKYPQLILYEGETRLASLLRPLADEKRWSVQEPKQFTHCLQLLESGGPMVLVVKMGRDLEREFSLLERVSWLEPQIATIAVGDGIHTPLIAPLWDLGVDYVLMPPQDREFLPAIVAGLMPSLDKGTP